MRSWGTRSRILTSAAVLTAAAVVLAPALDGRAAAHAVGLPDLICNGTDHAQFSPAVTPNPQTVTITAQDTLGDETTSPPVVTVGACVSLGSAIQGGVSSLSTTVSNISCNSVLTTITPTITYTWNRGALTSVVKINSGSRSSVNGNIVVTELGTVQTGFAAGDNVVRQLVLPNSALTSCQTGGLARIDGTATLTFTAPL